MSAGEVFRMKLMSHTRHKRASCLLKMEQLGRSYQANLMLGAFPRLKVIVL